jgi:hypothetical protein
VCVQNKNRFFLLYQNQFGAAAGPGYSELAQGSKVDFAPIFAPIALGALDKNGSHEPYEYWIFESLKYVFIS